MNLFIILVYTIPFCWIFLYSLGQLHLVLLYWLNHAKNIFAKKVQDENSEWPFVTIQLPVYNELYVIGNLIDAIAQMDYPKDRFEVQVLDDSTDETVTLIANKLEELKQMGLQVHHVRRPERVGYKAGALKYATDFAQGEFIAIFDADFQPKPNFLKSTLPYFASKNIGMVQTRWKHSNESYSLLTRLQALALNAHFIVEHIARNKSGYFMNFNGTAGVWRKDCIADAGGWEDDTLTEDLDLSYRAQLKGWQFVYLPEIESPSELPVEMSALRSQQYRWVKGPAECSRKSLRSLLVAKNINSGQKFHATLQLLNSSIFVSLFLLAISSLPLLFVMKDNNYPIVWILSDIFSYSFLFIALFFWTADQHIRGISLKNILRFILLFPVLWIFSVGLSLHNAVAAVEGFVGKKTPFVRTPKFNLGSSLEHWKGNKYISAKLSPFMIGELFFACYFLVAIGLTFHYQYFPFLKLYIIFFIGFTAVLSTSLLHQFKR